jgi:hypothetical protein
LQNEKNIKNQLQQHFKKIKNNFVLIFSKKIKVDDQIAQIKDTLQNK